nr:MAG TPA: hypothetical protein [Caudoviricetes sp.]DAX89160.1 MAG TPA: hypothetical protein [Caudoviricetes sp.]
MTPTPMHFATHTRYCEYFSLKYHFFHKRLVK